MMQVRRGLVITGGMAADKKWFDIIRDQFDYVVAADSGLDVATDIGADVDLAVGDMDSLQNLSLLSDLPPENVKRYNSDKDYTDTELGLQELRNAECEYTCIYGGGGGRLDHLLGIITLFERRNSPDAWVTDQNVILLIRSNLKLHNMAQKTVSFFPVGKDPCTMRSNGLKWELDSLTWRKGECGISNVVLGRVLEVEMKTGQLIYIGPLETLAGMEL